MFSYTNYRFRSFRKEGFYPKTLKVVTYWNRLPREVVDSPSLEMLRT